jgi:uncharacterized protein (DUF488 family)
MSSDSTNPIPIFTIGYGHREIETLLADLHTHNIQFLIDVRSQPYSRYKPDFNRKELEQHLDAAGIRYLFMGDTLGGRPNDPACYTNGKVDYDKVARKDFYRRGIDRLQEAFRQQQRLALMCSEGKPEQCHRARLIGRTLADLSIPVAHIDHDGRLITQQDVILRLQKGQPSLFGDDFHQFTSRKKYRPEDDDD